MNKRMVVALLALTLASVVYAAYFVDVNTNYVKTQIHNKAASLDSVSYRMDAIALVDDAIDRTLYTALEYTVTIANGDTCCGDTNGIGSGYAKLAAVDTGKIRLQGYRNGAWFPIRVDSGTLPLSKHIYLTGDSLMTGYDLMRLDLYLADTAAAADSVGWAPQVAVRLIK